MFALFLPPPAHQRECGQDARGRLEQSALRPPSGVGRADLRWPTCGLLSMPQACILSGPGLIQGSSGELGAQARASSSHGLHLHWKTQWGPGEAGTER